MIKMKRVPKKKKSTSDDRFSGACIHSLNLSTESYCVPGTILCTDNTIVAKAATFLSQVAVYPPGERVMIVNPGCPEDEPGEL